MDKNAIKKYAVWARRELISRVSQKALQYGISAEEMIDASAENINGKLLIPAEMNQRRALVSKIEDEGYEQVMEEVAYTWFNRFIALRFMEVNGYLPSHVRVFTDEDNNFNPQIITEAIHLELDGLDMEKVYAFKEENKTEELYKYLLITQCNALNPILPGMFQKIEDYTELLFPDNLLREGSVIEQMIALIPEDGWKDAVQIIGWLYEAYNTERNEIVYDGSMAKARLSKEFLPAATTIFTPDWAVRYMVENSLGRLWVDGHPNEELISGWKYYIDEAEQEDKVKIQLKEIRKEYTNMSPEDIKCIDPCCGSGHILVYMFDVLMQIYESQGYTRRDAVKSILKYNLYGLDIDKRAAQLAYFAVMMKARQYDRRVFVHKIDVNVYAIEESNEVNRKHIEYFGKDLSEIEKNNAKNQLYSLIDTFIDAKEYGSILSVEDYDWNLLLSHVNGINDSDQFTLETFGIDHTREKLITLINIGRILGQKYEVVVTNPPYLGSSRFSPKLDAYIKHNYADVKSDLSMVMYKHVIKEMVANYGFVSFITTSSWMYLSSFEKLRVYQQGNAFFTSLVDFGTELFEGKVGHNPIVAWVACKASMKFNMTAIRLVEYCYSRRWEKESEFFNPQNRFCSEQRLFSQIPGSPIAYWVSDAFIKTFRNKYLAELSSPKVGLQTGENEKFVRYWHEVSIKKSCFNAQNEEIALQSNCKWFPYNKGGDYRKWYGNNTFLVNWENGGQEIKSFKKSVIRNSQFYFNESITWSKISSGSIAFRYKPNGHIFDVAGTSIFTDIEKLYYLHGFCNSCVALTILTAISPTLNYEVGQISSLPIIFDYDNDVLIRNMVKDCINLSKADWDSFEMSWDFEYHPLVPIYSDSDEYIFKLSDFYSIWERQCQSRFDQLKENEEELNRIFIDIYGLQDELTPEVEDKDVTVRLADKERDIKSLISFAVGCMFGRYSLWNAGLAYAGGEWDDSKYNWFPADKDNIIPICDDEYFEDDIVGRFVEFMRVAYGEETLEENLQFVADALGGSGQPKEVIRKYFLNDFYKDHCKIYQKRPIYWLFDSGKKGGFKALMYMHRYQPDTVARLRTDYVHEQQARYRSVISDLEKRITAASGSEAVKLKKALSKRIDQAEEIRVYEEKVHHLADQMISIDLDDGVKSNYELFKDILAKIK